MNINWKVRFMNKAWVISMLAAVLVLVGALLKVFGIEIDMTNLQENLTNVVYAVFGVLAILGTVIDPTTEGISDSDMAIEYTIPGGFPEDEDEDEEDEE